MAAVPLSARYNCYATGSHGFTRAPSFPLNHYVVNYGVLHIWVRALWAPCCLPTRVCAGVWWNWPISSPDNNCMPMPVTGFGSSRRKYGGAGRFSGLPASRYWSVRYSCPVFHRKPLPGRYGKIVDSRRFKNVQSEAGLIRNIRYGSVNYKPPA